MEALTFEGGAVKRQVSTALYPRKAISDAQQAFSQHCRVASVPRPGGRLEVTVTPLSADAGEARATVLEFWNYCLARSCELRLD